MKYITYLRKELKEEDFLPLVYMRVFTMLVAFPLFIYIAHKEKEIVRR